jgi:hypothetical protein
MPLIVKQRTRRGMVWLKQGRIYSFNYTFFEHDPSPTVICINMIHGRHPNTGHLHNYMQAINLSYIPRQERKMFAANWVQMMEAYRGNVQFTWQRVQRKWPYMRLAIRRYILTPVAIRNLREIEVTDIETALNLSWARDFSKKVSMKSAKLMRHAKGLW